MTSCPIFHADGANRRFKTRAPIGLAGIKTCRYTSLAKGLVPIRTLAIRTDKIHLCHIEFLTPTVALQSRLLSCSGRLCTGFCKFLPEFAHFLVLLAPLSSLLLHMAIPLREHHRSLLWCSHDSYSNTGADGVLTPVDCDHSTGPVTDLLTTLDKADSAPWVVYAFTPKYQVPGVRFETVYVVVAGLAICAACANAVADAP